MMPRDNNSASDNANPFLPSSHSQQQQQQQQQQWNYYDNDSMTISSEQQSSYSFSMTASKASPPARQPRVSGGGGNRSSVGSLTIEDQQYLSNLQQQQQQQGYGDNDSIYSPNSKNNSPHPSFYDGVTSTRSSGFSSSNNPNAQLSSSVQKSQLSVLQNRILSIPVPTLRFDRLGSSLWNGTNTFLYDFEELQRTTHHTTFYLIDELKLKGFFMNLLPRTAGEDDFNDFNSIFRFVIPQQAVTTLGLTSLEKIFQKSGAIITTWKQLDFPQLKVFMNGWKAQQSSVVSKGLPNSAALALPVREQEEQSTGDPFHIGSTPPPNDQMNTKGGARLTKRRTSGEIKKDEMKNLQEMASLRLGITIPSVPPSNNTSRSQSLATVKSDSSPMNNNNSHSNDRNSGLMDFGGVSTAPALSLIDYWYLLRSSQLGMEKSSSNTIGKGMIAFERSNEIGFILRANAKFGIPEDIWCLFYMEDTMNYFLEQQKNCSSASTSLQMSFAAFLMHLLPQTRVLFQYLQHEQAVNSMRQQQQPTQAHHLPFQFNSIQSGNSLSFRPLPN
jgi:hypothetical protein